MKSVNVKAMILAAGAGSRLDPLTQLLPKPLVPIANRPVMEHVLLLLKKHNITEVAANLYHLADKVPRYFNQRHDFQDYKIDYVTEAKLSGDAGGLRACKKFFLDQTFIVLMGDIVTDVDLTELIRRHKASGAMATIALQEVENVEQFGIVICDDNGFINGFKEKPKASETDSRLASIGIYVFEPEIFNHIPESGDYMFGKQLFPSLLEQNIPVLGVPLSGYWSDIGTIASYKKTTFDGLDGLVALDLKGAGMVTMDDTATKLIGKNVSIAPDAKFSGHVVIGDNCKIGSGAVIANSIIWSDCQIGAGARVTDSILACGYNAQAGAILNNQTLLAQKEHALIRSAVATKAKTRSHAQADYV